MDWDKRFKEVKETRDIEKANKLLDDFDKEITNFINDFNMIDGNKDI